MTAADAMDGLDSVARALVGRPIERLQQVGGGRNSRVFRVDAGTKTFALKQYPSRAEDPRDRLGAEVAALEWMTQHELTCVPRVVAVDRERNYVLLSWLDGAIVSSVGASDVDQALAFLSKLHQLRATPAFSASHLASEACLSGSEIERQIRTRLTRLLAIERELGLREFLESWFSPALEAHLRKARGKLALSFERELAEDKRSLVPADFGYHNALRHPNGQLCFIDFEYFGWDDPVKLTADVLLHPGTPVSTELRARFRAGAETLYGSDATFARRLEAFYPLYGLRWGLILLNEFHLERWRRRILAGATLEWSEAKAQQLQAARDLVSQLPV
jgi:fructosamine-3-kinase